jgi:hypothetical protein
MKVWSAHNAFTMASFHLQMWCAYFARERSWLCDAKIGDLLLAFVNFLQKRSMGKGDMVSLSGTSVQIPVPHFGKGMKKRFRVLARALNDSNATGLLECFNCSKV